MSLMILRLYRYPLLLLVLSFLVLYVFGYWIPVSFVFEPIFKNLALAAYVIAPKVSLSLFAASIVWGLYNSYKYWQCYNGKGRCCDFCGGPVSGIKTGRYGIYVRCLMCGRGGSA